MACAEPLVVSTSTADILVVDDYSGTLETVSRMLALASFRVHQARDGQDAIRTARKHHLDLLVLDQFLPDMTGIDVAMTLHRSACGCRGFS